MITAKFLKSVHSIKDIPSQNLPELILCGRSNVGKSSFINSILSKRNLAKVGATPGKTKFLNYFLINEKFYIVDLPGLGYAKVSKEEREKWSKLIERFLARNDKIKLAVHIIDSRHEPTDIDLFLTQTLIKNNIPFIIVMNKIDKLNQSELNLSKKRVSEFYQGLEENENIFWFSSVNGTGKKEIIKFLKDLFEL